jgi:hypothetical protein
LTTSEKSPDHDTDENDINQVLASLELPIQRLWRIKYNPRYHGRHRDSKFPTEKRINAIREAPSVRAIEAPGTHPPAMHQLGHHATACNNKPACPKCPEIHAPNNCEAEIPKCLHCGARKCPKIKDAPITEQTPIAPTYIINPPTEFADPEVLMDESAEI